MRILSLLSVVAAVAVVGYLVSARLGGGEESGPSGTTGVDRAASQAASANLRAAAPALEAARAATGTYAGADVRTFGVRLVRADAASYCLEAGDAASPMRLAGPNGTPAPGRC